MSALSTRAHPALAPATLVAASVVTLVLPHGLSAQGTLDDYHRAEHYLPWNTDGLVLNERVQPHWIDEGDTFWYVQELASGHRFLRVDPAADQVEPAFDHQRLATGLGPVVGRTLKADSLPFETFEYVEGGAAVAVRAGGDRYRCDLRDYACVADPAEPDPPGLSPDGRWVAFVRGHDLWLRATGTGMEMRLTDDGERWNAWATPLPSGRTIIQQETAEPDQDPAVFWSPDSRRLLTYRIDARDAGKLSLVQHAPEDRIRPRHYTYAYPLPGDSVLPAAVPVMFEVPTGRRIAVPMEPIPLLYYGGPQFTWMDDGSAAWTVVWDRGYDTEEVRVVDRETGAVHMAFTQTDSPYVDRYAGAPRRFIAGGDVLLTGSERDGRMHLYRVDATTGRTLARLTEGDWDVVDLVHVDEDAGVILFTARGRESGEDPYLVHLYRMGLDGRGLRLLTPEPAEHAVEASPSGRWVVDTYSRPTEPPVTVLRRASDGTVVRELERADASGLQALGWRAPEPFEAVADDGVTPVYGIIWRPSTFDSTRTYPVVEYIYTGPHSFFVPKDFRAWRAHAQAVAELGFIVVQVDGRGTAGRGKDFQAYSYKNLGGSYEDHVAVLHQLGERFPYMDLDRVGIFGHSAGGYDSTHAILTHPEMYKVAVSSAGCHDNRLDKAVWNVQWMDWPVGPWYEEQSNVTLAPNLQGKLLLAHGDVDENVPVSATIRLVDALIAANKDFDLIIMPNRFHGFGNDPYFVRRRWDYFVENLMGVDPPRGYQVEGPEQGPGR